jgi:hypothetical protein
MLFFLLQLEHIANIVDVSQRRQFLEFRGLLYRLSKILDKLKLTTTHCIDPSGLRLEFIESKLKTIEELSLSCHKSMP